MIIDGWMIVSLAGFYGWTLSTVAFILKCFPEKGVFVRPKAIRWGSSLLLFFILWIVGMLHA